MDGDRVFRTIDNLSATATGEAERPAAFIFIGNGDSAGQHHPACDFNDAIIPQGISYPVRLVETALAAPR